MFDKPTISTGLPVKGNKKRAEARLMKEREKFNPTPKISQSDILFADYMEQWLDIIKPSIEVVTFASYSTMVKSAISPYFRKKKITLSNLKPKDIQDFYTEQLKRVKASSVIHYHANIHKALKYAVKMGLIITNPADQVDRPRKEKFVGSFYDSDEVKKLFEIAKGTKLELAVLFGAFYGLRRSEIVGLKWDAIDFKENIIVIRHTVTTCTLDGKKLTISKDRTKNVSSLRSLPLAPVFREKLLRLKKQQAENRRLFRKSYCTDYLDYIYVDELGERINPNYITGAFPKLLEQHNMTASILLLIFGSSSYPGIRREKMERTRKILKVAIANKVSDIKGLREQGFQSGDLISSEISRQSGLQKGYYVCTDAFRGFLLQKIDEFARIGCLSSHLDTPFCTSDMFSFIISAAHDIS